MDWWMRGRIVDPMLSNKLLGSIVVGEMPEDISFEELKAFFHQVPPPVKNTHPQQSCVTWALDAIRSMQKQGWAWEFDVEQFKDTALSCGDEIYNRIRVQPTKAGEKPVKYYLPERHAGLTTVE
ncbi:hypothetical protein E4U41_007048 [Claviceps citrina]|nr:hypothetical protein E4U41_007048 [Claviceps citrina]